MLVIAPSLQLKDKRIDKTLLKNGYDLKKCTIFYSPIKMYFIFLLMLFFAGGFYAFYAFYFLYEFVALLTSFIGVIFIFLAYITISLLLVFKLNNSVVLTDDELVIINPNFPFKKISKYRFRDIIGVKIDNYKRFTFLTFIFLLFDSNFIQIKLKNQSKRYYCIFLNVDAFDENWTELTLDDLHYSLENKELNVEMKL